MLRFQNSVCKLFNTIPVISTSHYNFGILKAHRMIEKHVQNLTYHPSNQDETFLGRRVGNPSGIGYIALRPPVLSLAKSHL